MLRLVERIALILRRYRSIGDREATYLMACDRRESKMDFVPFEIMPPPPRCSKKHCRTHFSKLFPRGPKPRDQALPRGPLEDAYPDHSCPYFDIIDWHRLDCALERIRVRYKREEVLLLGKDMHTKHGERAGQKHFSLFSFGE